MVAEDDGVTVGCKVPHWKRELFRDVADRQRTTMSALLRERVNDVLDEADIDRSDVSQNETEDATE